MLLKFPTGLFYVKNLAYLNEACTRISGSYIMSNGTVDPMAAETTMYFYDHDRVNSLSA